MTYVSTYHNLLVNITIVEKLWAEENWHNEGKLANCRESEIKDDAGFGGMRRFHRQVLKQWFVLVQNLGVRTSALFADF